ncbi:MAG: hypothetical protein V9F01_06210 [Chitinophagaceae bacterium]
MPVFRKLLILLATVVLLAGCKSKKKPSLSGEEPVEISDFIEFFQPVKLPYQVSDTALQKKEKDSLLISYKIFTQFVPDSVLSNVYGKIKPKIYALGKAEMPKGGTYLFVKTVTNDKKAILILSFDDKQQFGTSLAALRPDNNKATLQSVVMDKKYAITKIVTIKNPDGSISEGKDVYALDPGGKSFGLVMTDALSDKVTELINPIDTLPRKSKLSADYANGKMNLVSVRDGRKNDRITFFIHFEKNNGECAGELKGEAMLKSSNTAEYREDGDPCVLKFIFSSTSVTLKEVEGCGSRRGLNCSFDGSFARKKYVKPVSNSKPAKKK